MILAITLLVSLNKLQKVSNIRVNLNLIHKRTMFKASSEVINIGKNQVSALVRASIPQQRHMGFITIHKADPTKMDHQECEQNPIIVRVVCNIIR